MWTESVLSDPVCFIVWVRAVTKDSVTGDIPETLHFLNKKGADMDREQKIIDVILNAYTSGDFEPLFPLMTEDYEHISFWVLGKR